MTKQVILTRTWPSHVYLKETNTEIYLQAGELRDEARGGDIWDLELYDNMQCRFWHEGEDSTFHTMARYFNRTHIGCQIPTYSVEGPVLVDLTYDRRVTYSSATVPIYLVPAPEIVALNNTAYFYTHHE